MKAPENVPEKVIPASLGPCISPEILTPGNHLSFRVGPELLSGTVDAVMPDKSCFWIWTDGGMGRRMIDARDALSVQHAADL